MKNQKKLTGRLPGIVLCCFVCVPLCHAAGLPERTTKGGVLMLRVPGGSFTMGDSNGEVDEVEHAVTVSAFYLDQTEVTQEEFQRLMGENPSKIRGAQSPVEQIRWSDAVRYCNARSKEEGLEPAYDLSTWTCRAKSNGYRLPTEAEWEYACRAGTDTSYPFGNDGSKLKMFGWYKDTSGGKPKPVKKRRPNSWGFYDMTGNVWEWCNDFYAVDYYAESPEKDPMGPEKGEKKVLRGGCWSSSVGNCRSAYRYNENPAYTDTCFGYDIYGFRCVLPCE